MSKNSKRMQNKSNLRKNPSKEKIIAILIKIFGENTNDNYKDDLLYLSPDMYVSLVKSDFFNDLKYKGTKVVLTKATKTYLLDNISLFVRGIDGETLIDNDIHTIITVNLSNDLYLSKSSDLLDPYPVYYKIGDFYISLSPIEISF